MGLEKFADLKRGLGKKRRGDVFEGEGWDPNAHYELQGPSYWHKYSKQTM